MPARTHLSIGEVLSLLREEFPDVTISKIRFLESQGLVDPERTPSGYRKFYDHDVDRLRWILRQQREHFLPLKVIRGRLSEGDLEGDLDLPSDAPAGAPPGAPAGGPTEPDLAGAAGGMPAEDPPAAAEPAAAEPAPAEQAAAEPGGPAPVAPLPAAPVPVAALPPAVETTSPAPVSPPPISPAPVSPSPAAPPSVAPVPPGPRAGAAPTPEPSAAPTRPAAGEDASAYTLEELAAAAGVAESAVAELREYGLLGPATGSGRGAWYDPAALEVVRLAATFGRHGVEPRHLRAWRTSAEREASLFEQVIMPLLRQRNPQARHQAFATLDELTEAGGRLRAALLRGALRDLH